MPGLAGLRQSRYKSNFKIERGEPDGPDRRKFNFRRGEPTGRPSCLGASRRYEFDVLRLHERHSKIV
jgi:hypothetical protein